MKKILCRVCDAGNMVRQRQARMSPVVVFSGRIILIPSWLGIALGVLLLIGTFASPELQKDSGATAMGVGICAFLILSSVVGGLLGWLLTMKKLVLKCTNRVCGATVAAS
jgi:hypothetical protein